MIADSAHTSEELDRQDRELLAEVDAVLRHGEDLHALSARTIEATAHAGTISLRGHVDNSADRREAERLSAAVPGVAGVHNALVADPDLANAVARALAGDSITRASIFRVGASAGWIQIGGDAADAGVRDAARAVAAGVAAVRGVLSLPRLPGETAAGRRRTLQPRPGTAAYATDGELGEVVGVDHRPARSPGDPRHRPRAPLPGTFRRKRPWAVRHTDRRHHHVHNRRHDVDGFDGGCQRAPALPRRRLSSAAR